MYAGDILSFPLYLLHVLLPLTHSLSLSLFLSPLPSSSLFFSSSLFPLPLFFLFLFHFFLPLSLISLSLSISNSLPPNEVTLLTGNLPEVNKWQQNFCRTIQDCSRLALHQQNIGTIFLRASDEVGKNRFDRSNQPVRPV